VIYRLHTRKKAKIPQVKTCVFFTNVNQKGQKLKLLSKSGSNSVSFALKSEVYA